MVEGNVKISFDLGELELGKLDEDYFNDPDLDIILQETELDKGKLKRFEDEELRLIYSVIYSERFQLKGKRQGKVTNLNVLKRKPRATEPPFAIKIRNLSMRQNLVMMSGYTRPYRLWGKGMEDFTREGTKGMKVWWRVRIRDIKLVICKGQISHLSEGCSGSLRHTNP